MAMNIDDFIKAGKSLANSDLDLLPGVNDALRELNLGNLGINFTSKLGSQPVSRIGVVASNIGNSTTPLLMSHEAIGEYSKFFPRIDLDGAYGSAASILSNYDNRYTKPYAESLGKILDNEGITPRTNLSQFIQSSGQGGEGKYLQFDPDLFSSNKVEQLVGTKASHLSRQATPLFLSLHEYGHAASELAGADTDNGMARRALRSAVEGGAGPKEIGDKVVNSLVQAAHEEARAETFAYNTASRTTLGKNYLDELGKTVDFSKRVSNVDELGSFLPLTRYHRLGAGGFEYYANDLIDSAGVVGDEALKLKGRALAEANAAFINAIDYGEFSPYLDQATETLVGANRQHLLENYGEEAASIYDQRLADPQKIKYGIEGLDLGESIASDSSISKAVTHSGNATKQFAGELRAAIKADLPVLSPVISTPPSIGGAMGRATRDMLPAVTRQSDAVISGARNVSKLKMAGVDTLMGKASKIIKGIF